jgi:hypothetical protein
MIWVHTVPLYLVSHRGYFDLNEIVNIADSLQFLFVLSDACLLVLYYGVLDFYRVQTVLA